MNTTNRIAKLTSDTINVSVLDYVDQEELDANILFTGNTLKEYEINICTGKVTEIPLESEGAEEPNPADTEAGAEPVSDNTNAAAQPVNGTGESPETAESTEMVWISATGSKYHSIPNCGRMDPDKARQISKTDAEASGISACSKCH